MPCTLGECVQAGVCADCHSGPQACTALVRTRTHPSRQGTPRPKAPHGAEADLCPCCSVLLWFVSAGGMLLRASYKEYCGLEMIFKLQNPQLSTS